MTAQQPVIVPDHLAGEVARLLLLGLDVRARSVGALPTAAASQLVTELRAAAQRHRAGPHSPAVPPEPVPERDRTGETLSVAEAAAYRGCTPRRIRQMLAAGQLAGRKIGGRWIVHMGRLPDWEVPHADRAMIGA